MFSRLNPRKRRKFGKTSTVRKSAVVKPHVRIEDPIHVGPNCAISAHSIGRYTFVNDSTCIFGGVRIGRFVSFARGCQIGGAEHPIHHVSTSYFRIKRNWFPDDPLAQSAELIRAANPEGRERTGKTTIGNDVWIGAASIVLKGVTIGDGAVIGAGSIVTKDVPPYAIVAGNPARIVRYRFDPETVKRFLVVKWWDLGPAIIARLPLDNVEETLSQLEGMG